MKHFNLNVLLFSFCCLTTFNASPTWSLKKMIPFMNSQEEIEFGSLSIDADYTIIIKALDGSVVLKPSSNNLTINVMKNGLEEELPLTVVTKRIDKQEKVITLETVEKDSESHIQLDYTISVPENLKKIVVQGRTCNVQSTGLNADYDVKTQNGKIVIRQAHKNVRAEITEKGSIEIEHEDLQESTSLFLQSMNGDVTVLLPKNVNAQLRATTLKGEITSTIPVTLEARTTVLNKDFWKRMQREAIGTLGASSGAPITIDVTKGNIAITGY